MNILVVSQHYPPDFGAVSFRMNALVEELEKRNHQVYVLSANPHRYHLNTYPTESIHNAHVERISLTFNKSNTFHRILGFFEFYLKGRRKKKQYKDKHIDCVVSTTPYMLEGLLGEYLAKKLKSKHVLDVRDLWPETPVALGKIKKRNIAYKLLKRLERYLYHHTDGIVITSPGYLDHIKAINSDIEVQVVMNGIDKDIKCPESHPTDFKNPKKILYAGNLGVAQNMLKFVQLVGLNQDIELTLIGAGSELGAIESAIKLGGYSNIKIIPPMTRDDLLKQYCHADILYLQLYESEYFQSVIPSKVFEYLASSKPILYHLNGTVKDDILLGQSGTYYLNDFTSKALTEAIHQLMKETPIKRDTEGLLRINQTIKYATFIESVYHD